MSRLWVQLNSLTSGDSFARPGRSRRIASFAKGFSRRTPPAWLALTDVFGKGLDGSLPPTVGGDALADMLADLPVEVDERRVHGDEGSRSRLGNEAEHDVNCGARDRLPSERRPLSEQ